MDVDIVFVVFVFFFFQAEDGIRDCLLSRGLGDVYKRQYLLGAIANDLASKGGIATTLIHVPTFVVEMKKCNRQ
ncbi:primosomal protein DnaI [Lactobacillus rhamnosus GG] [Lacticaseibacillus rhamnosus]|nr:primosomal protein DnaI [Lactobacillus rhamnosus GG] [Lacticaseibacillus rhamnosus]